MSQENVEIVRRLIDAFNRGDMTRFIELIDPNVEWWDREDDPGATVHRGHDGVSTFLAELDADIELYTEPVEYIDAGDHVVVGVRLVGRGRTSGVPVDMKEVHVLRLRGGKITEVREFRTKAEALKAIGLSE